MPTLVRRPKGSQTGEGPETREDRDRIVLKSMTNMTQARQLYRFVASDTLEQNHAIERCGLGKGTMALVGDSAKPDDGAAIAAAGGVPQEADAAGRHRGVPAGVADFRRRLERAAPICCRRRSPSAHAFIDRASADLLRHGWITVYEMLAGYALAVGIAIPLAIAITSSRASISSSCRRCCSSRSCRRSRSRRCSSSGSASAPTPKILVAFLISFFPIVIDAAVGLRSMSSEMTRPRALDGRDAACRCSRGSACRPACRICSAA